MPMSRPQAGRSMPLNVSGGFHSPYMDPASAEFGAILADTVLQKPALPAYANRTAEPYGENVRELLTQQINHPVRWKETLRHLNEQGFDTFVECGAGMVLCKLVRKNLPECRSFAVDSLAGLAKLPGGGNAVLLRDLIREYTQSRTELPPAPPARPVPQTHVCPKCQDGERAHGRGAGRDDLPGLRRVFPHECARAHHAYVRRPGASRSWTPM